MATPTPSEKLWKVAPTRCLPNQSILTCFATKSTAGWQAPRDRQLPCDVRSGSIASVWRCPSHFRFANRRVEVKHFQAIHGCSVDVSHGLALLFGIGTKALPLWDSRTRRNNLYRGLAVSVTAGSSGSTNSPHPSSREGHLSTARWISGFLLSDLIFHDVMLLPQLVPWSSGTQCHRSTYGALSRPTGAPRPRSPFSSRGACRSAWPKP